MRQHYGGSKRYENFTERELLRRISDAELATVKAIHETEVQEEKADAQRRMAWISLISMIIFTILVFLPIFPDSRIKALADLFGLFYIGMAGVVGAYMGMTAYMSAKR
jgi:uncharacterized membrane protein YdjX (TVP38/TMEM64 family)